MSSDDRITFIDEEDEETSVDMIETEETKAFIETAQPSGPDKINGWLSGMFKWGTPLCGVLCGIFGAILAVMVMSIGFWKTLFVALLVGLGVFIGAVPNKLQWIRETINQLFPPKDQE